MEGFSFSVWESCNGNFHQPRRFWWCKVGFYGNHSQEFSGSLFLAVCDVANHPDASPFVKWGQPSISLHLGFLVRCNFANCDNMNIRN